MCIAAGIPAPLSESASQIREFQERSFLVDPAAERLVDPSFPQWIDGIANSDAEFGFFPELVPAEC